MASSRSVRFVRAVCSHSGASVSSIVTMGAGTDVVGTKYCTEICAGVCRDVPGGT
jgi:hypothetical protein